MQNILNIILMQQDKVNLFLASNAGKFRVSDLSEIKLTLEKMDETQYAILTGTNYMDPTLILVIAILLGWDRFFLDDIVLWVFKVRACYVFC